MSENATAPQTEELQQGPEGQEQKAPDLTIQDLQALRMIIDVASQRGTFKANEMASVGQVYNRLDVFLNAVAPAQQEEQKQG